jgi:hypothetical protein
MLERIHIQICTYTRMYMYTYTHVHALKIPQTCMNTCADTCNVCIPNRLDLIHSMLDSQLVKPQIQPRSKHKKIYSDAVAHAITDIE